MVQETKQILGALKDSLKEIENPIYFTFVYLLLYTLVHAKFQKKASQFTQQYWYKICGKIVCFPQYGALLEHSYIPLLSDNNTTSSYQILTLMKQKFPFFFSFSE